MPKGVEHELTLAESMPRAVQTAVMPKGVEHTTVAAARTMTATGVQTAVMPKGVEHSQVGGKGAYDVIVQTAVMPKGVEHSIQTRRARRGLDDECRQQ